MSSGKTLTALWSTRNVCEMLTPTERHVLHVFIAFMNANGIASPGTTGLVRATGYVKRTIISAVEALVKAGVITLIAESQAFPVKRCAVYRINIERIVQADDTDRDLRSPTSEVEMILNHDEVIVDPCSGDPGAPFEDLIEEEKRILEDSSPSLATSQAPIVASPSTARSPATTPPSQEPLLTSPTVVEAPKRKRAGKPKLAPLTVEALTPDERAVHDAIMRDVTLSQICHNVPQLARDLVSIAAGRVDVVTKVKALAVWNRNNPGKAWTTAGGNRGLTSCITRDAAQGSFGYPSTRPSPNAVAANGIQSPPSPQVVDLAKNPELMVRPMRTARFE
jgi:hypothetical protein